ncbi:peptidase domain-containing ABC transporter [Thalassoglobus polymorphus]|uniref:peptidase domain-containing ABC transporter n=1 Tax=Thalassoglobus polymorphus TaxID=2527994 RepID=UPI00119F0FDA|nr:ATP-binding cassette domain-containing protein [Thalassoglobus polymorphus]
MSRTRKKDLESAAWLLEKLAAEVEHHVDRMQIRRAVDEAAHLWSGQTSEDWWKWIVEASRSLGFKCKVIDGTFHQLKSMANDDARLLLRTEDGDWLAVAGSRGRKNLILQPFSKRERNWVGERPFRRSLKINSKDDVIRGVIFEPQLTGTIGAASKTESRIPINRLFALLHPERGDIAVIVIFALVIGILALATPLAVEMLVNTVAFGRVIQPLVVLALMLLAFLTFSAALRALQTIVVEMIQRRLFARVAADLSFRLPRVELESLDGRSGRELVNRFFEIVTIQKSSAQLLLDGISLVLGTLIGMAVLAFYHPWLLGFDVVLLFMIAFIILGLGRGAVQTSVKESKSKYRMAAWLENIVSCPIAIRHGGAGEFALERSDRYIHDYLTARKVHFRVLMRQVLFALGLQAFASTVLLGLGGWLVMSGQLTLGQLVASELIVTVIVGSFAKLGKHVESFYDLLAAVDKLGVLLDLPMEDQSGLLTFPRATAARVQIHNLSYSGKSGKDMAPGVNAQIAPGERVVVYGHGGSGKSQLLDMLFGTRTPSKGYLAINNIDPRDLRPDALRSHVSLVRNIEVFEGTIAENIHLKRPEVLIHDVRDALLKVGLLDKVLALRDGLGTEISEDGYPLSESQLKKLMIARGIVNSPSLLLIDGLLDELPDDDVQLISEVLFADSAPWTLIVVSGREHLIKKATMKLQLGKNSETLSNGVAHV